MFACAVVAFVLYKSCIQSFEYTVAWHMEFLDFHTFLFHNLILMFLYHRIELILQNHCNSLHATHIHTAVYCMYKHGG